MSSAFVSRKQESTILEDAWAAVQSGAPTVVVIRGDSGLGKTRLVQEFYHWLARDHDVGGYWPALLGGGGDANSLEPAIHNPDEEPVQGLPWLWLAIHLSPQDEYRSDMYSAVGGLRRQMALHLAAVYAAKRRRSLNIEVAKSTVSILSNFVFPGLGSGIQVGAQMLAGLDQGLSVNDAVRNIKSRHRTRQRGRPNLTSARLAERQSLRDATIEAIRLLCSGGLGAAVPVLLAIDDAHWADRMTLEVIDALLESAAEERWPLMVIMTAVEDALRPRSATVAIPEASAPHDLDSLLAKLREEHAFDPRRPEPVLLELKPLADDDARTILSSQLPTLTNDQSAIILRKADGDLELLNEYAAYVKDSGWMDSDGFSGSLTDLEGLTTVKREMVRRRLSGLDGDMGRMLAWASAQGPRFYEDLLVAISDAVLPGRADARDRLSDCESRVRIVRLESHAVFVRVGEFRRYIYYELSRERLGRLRERDVVWQAYADRLRTVVEDGRIEQLELPDQADITRDLLNAATLLRLDDADGDWRALLVDVRIRLAEANFLLGDFESAAQTAEAVFTSDRLSPLAHERALRVVVEVAQVLGDTVAEISGLERWAKVPGTRGPLFHSRRAEYQTRIGANTEALEDCRTALRLSRREEPLARVELEAQYVATLWFAGEAPRASRVLRRIEAEYAPHLREQGALRVRVDHVACVVLHDFDRNEEVIARSSFCVDVYQRLHRRMGLMRSLMNLGDAYWAVGRKDEALRVLTRAHEMCVREGGPHQVNIAAACLAHVLAHQGQRTEAIELYESALLTARKAGWVWDEIYVEIYLALVNCEVGAARPRALLDLARKAHEQGYSYLEGVAVGYAAMVAAVTGLPDQERVLDECDLQVGDTWVPLARAYLAAAHIAVSDDDSVLADYGGQLARAVSGCQGMHGRPEFLLAGCARLENAGVDIQEGGIAAWRVTVA